MHKKGITLAWLVLLMVCTAAMGLAQGTRINIYMDKAAMLAGDVDAADIRVKPEGAVRVTRHSLYPWDEEGSRFSMFVELENTGDEKIVIDTDWLYACGKDSKEIDSAACIFDDTTNVVAPGERLLLFAGGYPYAEGKRRDSDMNLDAQTFEGMEDFAGRIRQADVLRVRLETRGDESSQAWPREEIDARAWIEDGTICFETANAGDEAAEYRSIGVIVSDKEGRIVDVLREYLSTGASLEPGETLTARKALAPYVTEEMLEGATLETFAYRVPKK